MVEDTGIGGIGVGLRRLVWASGFVTAVAFAIAAGWLLQAEIEPIDATGSEILESATAHRASILALWVFWNAAVLAQLVFLTAFALAVWRGGNTVAALAARRAPS